VSGLALGDQHTLFLDRAGGVWAVGCTLEGQCGLGQPIEDLARQHRRALYGSVQLEALLRAGRPAAPAGRHEAHLRAFAEAQEWSSGGGGGGMAAAPVRRGAAGARTALAAALLSGGGGPRFGQFAAGGAAVGGFGGPSGDQLGSSITASGIWGIDLGRHLSETGVQPGVVPAPTRVERPRFPGVWGAGGGAGGGPGAGAPREGEGPGLESERVVGVDASRFFSIAVTDSGRVWTWGASYTGALAQGGGVSWATAATPISGPIADAVESEGGAVAVAAGGNGAACLTARCGPGAWPAGGGCVGSCATRACRSHPPRA
jgi:hypothetical protein